MKHTLLELNAHDNSTNKEAKKVGVFCSYFF